MRPLLLEAAHPAVSVGSNEGRPESASILNDQGQSLLRRIFSRQSVKQTFKQCLSYCTHAIAFSLHPPQTSASCIHRWSFLYRRFMIVWWTPNSFASPREPKACSYCNLTVSTSVSRSR